MITACHLSTRLFLSFLFTTASGFAQVPANTTTKAPDAVVARPATPAESLKVADGFKVELLRSAQPGEGSWVAMTVDPKGRLIISPQGKEPMLRVTLDANGQIANLEKIDVPVTGAMGLLCMFDSLYVNGRGPQGYHLYRLRDTDGDDNYDSVELLRRWNGDKGGDGEHGAHAIRLGPDKKLYIVNGNFVDVPRDILSTSPHKNYADDLVLPRMEDGNGFGAGRKPPGGYVVRLDPDGKNAELLASGQRNTYDIAFSPEGELFGFDSDMEWDWGTPWYRPTRVYHIVSGGDQGFREGTAKWPEYYPDSLPATVNIGIGSPTGVEFGTGAKFPLKYQKALYALDWSYGRILAVHLTPKGASYTGTFENFVAGKPLNVTDLVIGKGGAMYFTVGGRGTQAGLYRVAYAGADPTPVAQLDRNPAFHSEADARALRHQLEALHGRKDPATLDVAWPHLDSEDRHIRYAARIAIESQPVEQWRQRAFDEERKRAGLTALLALARTGDKDLQAKLLKALEHYKPDDLDEEQKLEALRVLQVAFVRMGRPDEETARDVARALDAFYPSPSERLNRELCQLLIYLDAPGVVQKTLGLLAKAPTQEEQIHYMLHLRGVTNGWTMDDRKVYFGWFNRPRETEDGGPTYPGGASYTIVKNTKHPAATVQWFKDVGREYGDGSSFPKFMANIRNAVIGSLTDAERAELAPLITAQQAAAKPKAQRGFVKEWKMEDLLGSLDQVSSGRNFQRGKEAYEATQCLACHRFGNEGGAIGPDVTAISSRFTRRDLLSSIIEPSKVVSEQYQNMTITRKNGDDLVGRILEINDNKVLLLVNPLTGDKAELKRSDVARMEPSKVSPMPEGLVNILSKEEILDLIAYIESAGKKDHAAFAK